MIANFIPSKIGLLSSDKDLVRRHSGRLRTWFLNKNLLSLRNWTMGKGFPCASEANVRKRCSSHLAHRHRHADEVERGHRQREVVAHARDSAALTFG
jgi:hypothetical protein